ncbi:hypothetical protein F4694_003097 [Bacillus niacini]|uniref:Uncharacterized protein n=1 Tax=Neobacillus niacini TaxID=86668 RepID=A0A852TF99_9BACI|nr:hypothetical protein [Neobacillus niacini]
MVSRKANEMRYSGNVIKEKVLLYGQGNFYYHQKN